MEKGSKVNLIKALSISATDDLEGDITSKVKIDSSNLNINEVGVYQVKVSVKDSSGNKAEDVIYNVTVKEDVTAPVITGKSAVVAIGSSFEPIRDLALSVIDDKEGDITSKAEITNNVNTAESGIYKVNVKVTDNDGNVSEKDFKVRVFGGGTILAEDVNSKVGENFDPMTEVKALDVNGEDITSKVTVVSNNVDINNAGTYKVVYSTVDSDGNKITAERVVKVEKNTDPEEPGNPENPGNPAQEGTSKTHTVNGPIYTSTTIVTGTAGANADIVLSVDEIVQTTTAAGVQVVTKSEVDEKEIGAARADENGKWSAKISAQNKGTVIKITAKEEGKLEAAITVTVIRKSSSSSSSNFSKKDNTVTVEGSTTVIKSTDPVYIEQEIKKATTPNIKVDVSSKPVINKNILRALVNNPNETLILVGDNVSWIFKGVDMITDGTEDIDTTIKSVSQNAAMINSLVNGKEVVHLSFVYKGLLPGKATIKARVDSKYNNKTMYMYSYNLENNRLILASQSVLVKEGIATFEISKGSDYILSEVPIIGAVKEGWNRTSSGNWIFVKNENNVIGWIKDGAYWYLTDNSGTMKTGWVKDTDGNGIF